MGDIFDEMDDAFDELDEEASKPQNAPASHEASLEALTHGALEEKIIQYQLDNDPNLKARIEQLGAKAAGGNLKERFEAKQEIRNIKENILRNAAQSSEPSAAAEPVETQFEAPKKEAQASVQPAAPETPTTVEVVTKSVEPAIEDDSAPPKPDPREFDIESIAASEPAEIKVETGKSNPTVSAAESNNTQTASLTKCYNECASDISTLAQEADLEHSDSVIRDPSTDEAYKIALGDTLYAIVQDNYDTDPDNPMCFEDIKACYETIAAMNGIDDPNKIDAGAEIKLPQAEQLQAMIDKTITEQSSQTLIAQNTLNTNLSMSGVS